MLKRLIYTDRAVIGKDAFGNDIVVEGQFFTWFGRQLRNFHG